MLRADGKTSSFNRKTGVGVTGQHKELSPSISASFRILESVKMCLSWAELAAGCHRGGVKMMMGKRVVSGRCGEGSEGICRQKV